MEFWKRMNFNSAIFLLFAFFIFCGNVFSQDCRAPLNILTDNKNSNIYLNNKLIGKREINIDLEMGEYFIHISGPEKRWAAKNINDTIIINSCDSVKLNYSLNTVYLKTDPPDAYVFQNNILIGHTPLFISKNYGRIVLSKPGYNSEAVSLNDLNESTINLKFTGEENGRRFYEKSIFKILVAGIVALGGATAYFKLRADDKFEKYQSNGDQNLLDQTKKYDLISGITMGALQINFGVLIYYFLTD